MESDIRLALTWNGTNGAGKPVTSGVYYCKMAAGNLPARGSRCFCDERAAGDVSSRDRRREPIE